LGNFFIYLKKLLMTGLNYLSKRGPEKELNKPSDQSSAGSKQRKFFSL